MVLATGVGRWNKLSLILACSPGFDFVLFACIWRICWFYFIDFFLCSKTIMMEVWIIFLRKHVTWIRANFRFVLFAHNNNLLEGSIVVLWNEISYFHMSIPNLIILNIPFHHTLSKMALPIIQQKLRRRNWNNAMLMLQGKVSFTKPFLLLQNVAVEISPTIVKKNHQLKHFDRVLYSTCQ